MKFTNDYFFDDLTHPDTQYVLGFLCADGCVTINPKKCVSFSSKDKEILDKIQKIIPTEYKVGFDGRSTYQIKIYSDKLYNRAIELGIPERKSLIISYPDWANNHFIRGYFDGDGTVYKVKNRPAIRCEILSGSREFIIGLERHLQRVGLKYHYRRDEQRYQNTYYKINIHRKSDILRFERLLYSYDSICLLRKRRVFQKWLQKTQNIGKIPEMGNSET